ncbi:MAG: helix-turn-helix domain-containing protein [Pseudanabaena sp.]
MTIKFYESPFHAIKEPEVASKSVLKADLTIMIRDIIEDKGWTQKEAAERLAVTQPRVSDIVNGKIDKFTLDIEPIWYLRKKRNRSQIWDIAAV